MSSCREMLGCFVLLRHACWIKGSIIEHLKVTKTWSETTLNYLMMVETYPNLKEEVWYVVRSPAAKSPLYLTENMPRGQLPHMCFGVDLSTFCLKQHKKVMKSTTSNWDEPTTNLIHGQWFFTFTNLYGDIPKSQGRGLRFNPRLQNLLSTWHKTCHMVNMCLMCFGVDMSAFCLKQQHKKG